MTSKILVVGHGESDQTIAFLCDTVADVRAALIKVQDFDVQAEEDVLMLNEQMDCFADDDNWGEGVNDAIRFEIGGITFYRTVFHVVAGCNVPPAGWWCSRVDGHTGPCAARPSA